MAKTRIMVVRPNTTCSDAYNKMQKEGFERLCPDVEIGMSWCTRGGSWDDTEYDEALAGYDMLTNGLKAQQQNYDGIIIGSCCDANLDPLKQFVNIPVVGPGEASMLVAAFLVDKFSVLTISTGTFDSMMWRSAERLGIVSKVASIRRSIPGKLVMTIPPDMPKITRVLVDEAKRACDDDGAHAVILASLAFERMGIQTAVKETLAKEGYGDLLVLGPAQITLNFIRFLSECGLTQGRMSFRHPPSDKVYSGVDWEFPHDANCKANDPTNC